MGVSYALNQCLLSAKDNHFCWLLSLDQDSVVAPFYIKYVTPYLKDEIGIIAPTIIDTTRISEDTYATCNLLTIIRNRLRNKNCISMPITSGSVLNINNAINAGGFDNGYFIDLVDFDFDLRLHEHRYKIITVPDLILSHSLGVPKGHYFLGLYFIASGHPAWRYYYMARNTWLLFYDHYKDPISKKWVWRTLLRSTCPLFILNTLIANNWDMRYLKYILTGNFDGIRRKLRSQNEILRMFP